MGTEARIVLHAGSRSVAEVAARAAFARIAALDHALSDYRADGELSALAGAAGGPPVPVSKDLLLVLRRALDLARETDGAFDPTVGPLSVLWRTARRARRLPSAAAVAHARSLVGWRRIALDADARTARLALPGMRLDLGAIAKGFAADEALATLRAHGVSRALVAFGGEIVAGDAPPGEDGWRVRVEGAADGVLELENAALSSSGDTEQFMEIGDVRYSHVLDPRTGMPLTRWAGATVRAADGITADAYATAVTVLDSAARTAFIARHPAATFHVRRRVSPRRRPRDAQLPRSTHCRRRRRQRAALNILRMRAISVR